MLRAVVINLARSEDRREAIAARLADLQIPFAFSSAEDGEKLTAAQLSLYSARDAFAQIGRELHPNEVACLLSHIKVWRDLVGRQEEYALVIEDDMLIDSDFPSLIEDLTWIPVGARVVNFSWDMASPRDLQQISATRWCCRFDKPVMRTGTYILSRKGAEQLLKSVFPIRMPVDSLMGDESNVGAIYGVTPRPVRWDEAVASATWTDCTMDYFTKSSRRSIKGIYFRLVNRLSNLRNTVRRRSGSENSCTIK